MEIIFCEDIEEAYIQNAVDSIDEKIKKVEDTVEHYKIDIQIEPLSGTISIRDNGEGIAFNIAEKSLVDIGNSDKYKKNRYINSIQTDMF